MAGRRRHAESAARTRERHPARCLPLRYAGGVFRSDAPRAAEGCRMSAPPPEIRSVPVDLITILNPRVRNKRIFQELVNSIAHLGLKKPITVSQRPRSDEHTSELQSLMRISYAVFCLKK